MDGYSVTLKDEHDYRVMDTVYCEGRAGLWCAIGGYSVLDKTHDSSVLDSHIVVVKDGQNSCVFWVSTV